MKEDNTITKNIGRITQIDVYEISNKELDSLEKGTSTPTYLIFAVALLTTGISSTITIFTITTLRPNAFAGLLAVMITCYALGFILLIFWLKSKKSHQKLINEIRSRV